jgi:hypothetical protein
VHACLSLYSPEGKAYCSSPSRIQLKSSSSIIETNFPSSPTRSVLDSLEIMPPCLTPSSRPMASSQPCGEPLGSWSNIHLT